MKFVTVVRSSLRRHAEIAAEALSEERIPVRHRIEGSQAVSGWGSLVPFALEPLGHVFVVRVPESAVESARTVLSRLSLTDEINLERSADDASWPGPQPRGFFKSLLRRQDATVGAAFIFVLERIRCLLDRDYEAAEGREAKLPAQEFEQEKRSIFQDMNL